MKPEANPPARLYKYVGASGIKILQTKTVRFTRPSLLNDPFEVRPFLKTIGGEEDWTKQFDSQMPVELDKKLAESPEHLRQLLPRELLLGQLDSQKPLVLEAMRSVLQQLTPTMNTEFYKQADAAVGILSLTENPSDLLMWSHYADFHRGLVIEFDPTSGFFNRRRSASDEFYVGSSACYIDASARKLRRDEEAVAHGRSMVQAQRSGVQNIANSESVPPARAEHSLLALEVGVWLHSGP